MLVKEKYRCHRCEELHDEEFDAAQCCDPEKVIACGGCGKAYDPDFDKAKAEACCAPSELSRCLCGAIPTPEDEHDSRLIGTVLRCRACILKVAPEVVTA